MGLRWRRRSMSGPQKLLRAANLNQKQVADTTELAIAREVAYQALRTGSNSIGAVLSTAEDLLADEAEYGFVVMFLEDVQNLVSHRLDTFISPEQVVGMLGPRCAVVWPTLANFWDAVAAWCAENRAPLPPSDEILAVEDEQLRVLLWTSNRTLADGAKLSLADAVRYENAGGECLPNYSHIEIALRATGQA